MGLCFSPSVIHVSLSSLSEEHLLFYHLVQQTNLVRYISVQLVVQFEMKERDAIY